MKAQSRNLLFTLCGSVLLATSTAYAAPLYWDTNGATAGAGGTTSPSGTWSTLGSTWSTSPDGTLATSALTTTGADDLFFSAGITATGAYSVTINDAQSAKSLTFEEGTATISGAGGVINLGGVGDITVNNGPGGVPLSAIIGANTDTIIGGSVGLTKRGVGTLTLNGTLANTFTGGLNINGGTLALNYANLATPTDLINSGNALSFGGGTLSLTGKSTGTTDQTFGNVTVNSGGGQLLGSRNGGTALNITLGSLTTTASGGSLLIGTTIGGTSPVITTTTDKDATGIYGGRAVFSSGTANTGYDWVTSSGSGTYTLAAYSGYTPMATSGIDTNNSRITAGATLLGNLTTNTLKFQAPAANQVLALGGNTLTLTSGGLLITGGSVSNGPTISGGNLTAGNSSGSYDLIIHQYNAGTGSGNAAGVAPNTNISAAITNNGMNAVTVVKAGTGQLLLSGVNTFTGGIIVNGGNLFLNNASALNNNSITFNANATLINQTAISSSGGITINNGSTVSFAHNTTSLTLAGAVTGIGGGITLAQAGGGATNLNFNSTANTFTGPIEYRVTPNSGQNGSLSVNSLADSGALGQGNIRFGVAGTGTNQHVFSYGSGAIANLTLDNRQFELAGSHALPVINNNSARAFTINTDLLSSGTGTKTLTLGGTGAGLSEFAGDITNGTITTLNITKAGSAVWTLSGDNSFNGNMTLSGASVGSQLNINSATALGTGTFIINGGNNAKFDNTSANDITLANNNLQTWSNDFAFVGTKSLNMGTGAVTLGGTRGVTVSASTLTIGGIIDDGASSFGITKNGNGKLVLGGVNAYNGATIVSAGTLEIAATGSTNSSSAVTVNGTAALVVNGTLNGTLLANSSTTVSGTGTVVGAAIINGTLAPGNSPGQMNYSNTLTLAGNTVMEIDGTAGAGLTGGHDFVNLTGTDAAGVLTYGGIMTLDIGTIFGEGSYSWNLFDMASETATFSSISLTGSYSGGLADGDSDGVWNFSDVNNTWSFTENTGVLNLVATVIPEPSSALLGFLGMLLLLRRRR